MTMRHATMRQLQVFECAVRHVSFSRAAEELHLTQPAVSMQIREIEASAGVPLFERINGKLFVTEAGQELTVHAREILRALDSADEALDALKGLRGGRIEIAVTSTAQYLVPQLLVEFRRRFPAVEMRLSARNRKAVIEQLIGNEVALAIMGRPPEAAATEGTPFAPHPFVIVAAPDHRLASRRRIPVAALADETLLVREPGSGTRTAMESYFGEHGVEISDGMELASNETIKQAVMAGMGISFISRHTVGLELRTGRLALLRVQGLPVMRQWYVVHLASKRLSPAAAAFKAFVLAHGRAILEARTSRE